MSQNDPFSKQVHNQYIIDDNSSVRVEFLAGLGSAVLTIGLTYPVTKLIYRQIIENQNARHSLKTLQKEGFMILYRGAMPPMLQRCVALSSMFSVYKAATIPLENLNIGIYPKKISACFLAGTFESFFLPLERIQILLITSAYNTRFKNMFHLMKTIATEYNLKEFYRGYTIILFRNVSANSCFFITREELNKRYAIDDKNVSLASNIQQFAFGSLIGTSMTILFYPIKVMKVNVHQKLGGKFKNFIEISKEVYRKNGGGITNFYRGIVINSFRSIFAWGITNSSYDYIKKQLT